MKKYLIYLMASVVAFSGCSTMDVSVDYDESFNLSKQKTYAIARKTTEGENSLFIDRVTKAIESNLDAKNYTKSGVDAANILVTFNAKIESKTSTYTDYQAFGIGRYRYGGAMISTTSSYDYEDGTLVIDVINPKTNKIVWRGVGQTEVEHKKTPQEKSEYINSIVTQIMEQFPIQK